MRIFDGIDRSSIQPVRFRRPRLLRRTIAARPDEATPLAVIVRAITGCVQVAEVLRAAFDGGQHSTALTARPPCEVSLYFDCMSAPVTRIVSMTWSRLTLWVPSPLQGERGRGDRLVGAEGVALDARDLHQAADRVAGHAEVMLHADLGGVLDLLVGAAERRGQARRGHRGRRRRPRPGSRPRRRRSRRSSCTACRSPRPSA